MYHLLFSLNRLGEINGVDETPENRAVSVSWFVVADPLSWVIPTHSTYPDIVGRVGWINKAGAAWEKGRVVPAFIVLLPAYTEIRSVSISINFDNRG